MLLIHIIRLLYVDNKLGAITKFDLRSLNIRGLYLNSRTIALYRCQINLFA